MKIPVVTFSGQSLRTLDDESLLQLLLRPDLPTYLNNLYAAEADRRMQQQPIAPQEACGHTIEVLPTVPVAFRAKTDGTSVLYANINDLRRVDAGERSVPCHH